MNINIKISKRVDAYLGRTGDVHDSTVYCEVIVEHVCIPEWLVRIADQLVTQLNLTLTVRDLISVFIIQFFLGLKHLLAEREREGWVMNTPNCQNQRDRVVLASKSVCVVTFTVVKAATALPLTSH